MAQKTEAVHRDNSSSNGEEEEERKITTEPHQPPDTENQKQQPLTTLQQLSPHLSQQQLDLLKKLREQRELERLRQDVEMIRRRNQLEQAQQRHNLFLRQLGMQMPNSTASLSSSSNSQQQQQDVLQRYRLFMQEQQRARLQQQQQQQQQGQLPIFNNNMNSASGGGGGGGGGVNSNAKKQQQIPANMLGKLHPLRILVVEDEETNQLTIIRQLLRLGYNCDMCVNGQELVDKLTLCDVCPYDVILLDLYMPVMDGFKTMTWLVQKYDLSTRPYVVAVTASDRTDELFKCLSLSMDSYIAKPVDPKQMAEVLRKLTPLQRPVSV